MSKTECTDGPSVPDPLNFTSVLCTTAFKTIPLFPLSRFSRFSCCSFVFALLCIKTQILMKTNESRFYNNELPPSVVKHKHGAKK